MKRCMDFSPQTKVILKYSLRGKKWWTLCCQELEGRDRMLWGKGLGEECVGCNWHIGRLLPGVQGGLEGVFHRAQQTCLRRRKPGFVPRTNTRKDAEKWNDFPSCIISPKSSKLVMGRARLIGTLGTRLIANNVKLPESQKPSFWW